MLERFGEYYMVFLREDGYDNLLRCLGDSLQEWLSNINNLHAHLKHVFPEFKSNVSPQIWYVAERWYIPYCYVLYN